MCSYSAIPWQGPASHLFVKRKHCGWQELKLHLLTWHTDSIQCSVIFNTVWVSILFQYCLGTFHWSLKYTRCYQVSLTRLHCRSSVTLCDSVTGANKQPALIIFQPTQPTLKRRNRLLISHVTDTISQQPHSTINWRQSTGQTTRSTNEGTQHTHTHTHTHTWAQARTQFMLWVVLPVSQCL